MLRALGYGELVLTDVNGANQALVGLLKNPDPQVELFVANGVWYQSGLQVASDFGRVAKRQYGAALAATRFGDPEAAAVINRWVSKQTRGRISQLVDQTRPEDRMWLVNALYFKGQWQKPFDPALTRERPFYGQEGSVQNVPFMF